MQPQGDAPNNISQYRCIFHASHPSEGVRLTAPAGDQRDPSHIHNSSQSMGTVTVDPAYWSENYPVPGDVVWAFFPGHPGPHGFLHGQWCPCAYTPDQLPEDPDVGEIFDPGIAAWYPDTTPRRDVGPGSEDPGISPRCGTDPGSPIHLTTSIRASSSQVSYPHLVEEVCPYPAWKTHWY